MRGLGMIAIALALGALSAPAGLADVLPPPGFQQQQFLELITAAGFPCSAVTSFARAGGPDAGAYEGKGLDLYTVQCSGDRSYFVAIPARRPGPPRLGPDGKPIPLPAPVVKPLAK